MIRINKLSMLRLQDMADRLPGMQIESRTYDRSETVFEEGKYAKGVFYIESGTILLSSEQQIGKEVVINVIGSNNFIGFLPLIQKTKLTSTAMVLDDQCQIKFISKALFQEAMADNQFLQGFMKILCQLIDSMEMQNMDFKTKNVRTKLATALISLDTAFKKSTKDSQSLITLKKKDLASLIGAAPETLSRNLAEFEKEGLIELHVKGIKIKNITQLLADSQAVL